MPVNLYEAMWIFVVYAFLGWCAEVAFAAVDSGKFVNRGFMNGPYCPIYGVGVLVVVWVLTPLKDNTLILFGGSVLLTSLLEYIVGFLLERLFGNRWWDYSNMPFNIRGYVCLKFSLMWGLGCMLIMDMVHPAIYRWIQWMPQKAGTVFLAVFLGGFLADLCVTVNTVLKLNAKLRALEKTAQAMRKLSDEIGEDIYEKVAAVEEKRGELEDYLADKRVEIEEKKQRLQVLTEEYERMIGQKQFAIRRLTKAFPHMHSLKWDEIFQQYKKFLEDRHPEE